MRIFSEFFSESPYPVSHILENFRDLGIELNLDWLAGVELLLEEDMTTNTVYVALTQSDLRESCNASRSWERFDKGRRPFPDGSFLFQISAYADVSIPSIDRPNRSEGSAKRVLKMELTCGPVTLHAIELEPCTQLTDEPEPGLKVIISGSPLVLHGLILLTPANIRIVGGEVPRLVALHKSMKLERTNARDPLMYPMPISTLD